MNRQELFNKAFENLKNEEEGYPDRIIVGKEVIEVLNIWYQMLLDMGYYLKDGDIYRKSDDKALALVCNIERMSIGVLPILSYQ